MPREVIESAKIVLKTEDGNRLELNGKGSALYEAPPDVASLRKELESANDFIKSLADVCQKYEELLGYRKTNAPEGASFCRIEETWI